MRIILILTAMLLSAAPAMAQHAHGSKGPNGGMMEDVAGVHAELIISGNTITFNIVDEASKPVATNGFTGSVLVTSGAEKETVTLSPAGESALKGEAKKAIPANASVTLMLKTKAGKSGQAKFTK
jgi:nitrogen fixation protein FixH